LSNPEDVVIHGEAGLSVGEALQTVAGDVATGDVEDAAADFVKIPSLAIAELKNAIALAEFDVIGKAHHLYAAAKAIVAHIEAV
jgi:hypothetical protein